jgi:hypothetical protein
MIGKIPMETMIFRIDKVLTVEDLNQLSCGDPDCTRTHDHRALMLASDCHDDGVDIWYSKPTESLLLACAACGRTIAMIRVAHRVRDEFSGVDLESCPG